jgi:flagellar hook-basal body complex protein FliE
MIDAVTAQNPLVHPLRVTPGADGLPIGPLHPDGAAGPGAPQKGGSFADMVGQLVQEVDAKGKTAESEMKHLMLGESDNIHRSMIAMQEAGVAFTLLVEVRNKLVESYQELMRMPV